MQSDLMNISLPANRTNQTDNRKGQANHKALQIKHLYEQFRGRLEPCFIFPNVSILGVQLKGTLNNGTSSTTLGESQGPQTQSCRFIVWLGSSAPSPGVTCSVHPTAFGMNRRELWKTAARTRWFSKEIS